MFIPRLCPPPRRVGEREREGEWSVCFLVGGGFDWVLILLFDNLGEVWGNFIVSLEVRLEFWRGWNNNVSSMGGVLFFFLEGSGGGWLDWIRLILGGFCLGCEGV